MSVMRATAFETIPTFQEAVLFPSSSLGEEGGYPFGIDAADYDNDMHVDLVVVNAPVTVEGCYFDYTTVASVTVLHNTGDWNPPSDGFVLIDMDICNDCAPAEVKFADMNGDNLLDIVVSASDGNPDLTDENHDTEGSWGIYIAFQDSNHDFSEFTEVVSEFDIDTPPRGLVVFDIDADNGPDVAVAGDDCHDDHGEEANDIVYVFRNDGNGNLTRSDTEDVGLGSDTASAFDLVHGHFNTAFPSQNKEDMVSCNLAGDSVSVLTNLGNGNFTHSTSARPNSGCGSFWSFGDVVAGQFNSSGLDFAVVNETGSELRVYYGNGFGAFSHDCDPSTDNPPGDWYTLSPPEGCIAAEVIAGIAAGKLNTGNQLDLAVTRPTCGEVAILLGIGPGSTHSGKFQFDVSDTDYFLSVSPSGGGAQVPVRVIIADVDGDEVDDIVTVNHDSRNISVLINEL